jgi:glycerol-3-phosphate dehydrogenase subunit C
MTETYQPSDPAYFDEADGRREMARVFDLCNGCRRCTDLCGVFPSLFERLDDLSGAGADQMTPAEQDAIAEQCFHCGLCAIGCPYLSDRSFGTSSTNSSDILIDTSKSESHLDFPRLMVRAAAIRHRGGHLAPVARFTSSMMNRTSLLGAIGVRASGLVNRVLASEPESLTRRAVATMTGISAVRLLPPYTRQRFSTWFRQRPQVAGSSTAPDRQRVTVFPTCTVEYLQPEIGRDLVKVFEHNSIACSLSSASCCGAPWLHSGDLQRFESIAAKNVRILAEEIRTGSQIVVPQPTCAMVLKQSYRDHVPGSDADLVAANTWDVSEFLLRQVERGVVDLRFEGEVPSEVTYHAPCHLRALGLGRTSADLMALTGAKVTVIEQCSGTDGLWGLRKGNEATAVAMAKVLGAKIETAGAEVVTGDCHLANTAIAEATSHVPMHPVQFLARAYGIDS